MAKSYRVSRRTSRKVSRRSSRKASRRSSSKLSRRSSRRLIGGGGSPFRRRQKNNKTEKIERKETAEARRKATAEARAEARAKIIEERRRRETRDKKIMNQIKGTDTTIIEHGSSKNRIPLDSSINNILKYYEGNYSDMLSSIGRLIDYDDDSGLKSELEFKDQMLQFMNQFKTKTKLDKSLTVKRDIIIGKLMKEKKKLQKRKNKKNLSEQLKSLNPSNSNKSLKIKDIYKQYNGNYSDMLSDIDSKYLNIYDYSREDYEKIFDFMTQFKSNVKLEKRKNMIKRDNIIKKLTDKLENSLKKNSDKITKQLNKELKLEYPMNDLSLENINTYLKKIKEETDTIRQYMKKKNNAKTMKMVWNHPNYIKYRLLIRLKEDLEKKLRRKDIKSQGVEILTVPQAVSFPFEYGTLSGTGKNDAKTQNIALYSGYGSARGPVSEDPYGHLSHKVTPTSTA